MLGELCSSGVLQRGFGVFLGGGSLRDGPLLVLPVQDFVAALYSGEVI